MQILEDLPHALDRMKRARSICGVQHAMARVIFVAVTRELIDEEGGSPVFASLLYDAPPAATPTES